MAHPNPVLVPITQASDETSCGTKAFNLYRLVSFGVPVPEGLVLTNQVFEGLLRESGLDRRIEALTRGLNYGDIAELEAASTNIRRLLSDQALDMAFLHETWQHCRHELGEGRLIVRSSGVGEDSSAGSYAGQLDSILDVDSATGLQEAVLQCWASRWSARSLSYQFAQGCSLGGLAVIIQVQLDPSVSGVLFTHPPSVGGFEVEQELVEFCYGHGAALAAGEINPGRFVREADGWKLHTQPEQTDIPVNLVNADVFWLQELEGYAHNLERSFGMPQDIEWAVDEGGLWIVQSRPISETRPPPNDQRSISWTNANINENYPDPVSPFLYSIATESYSHYFRSLGRAFGIRRDRLASVSRSFDHIVGLHVGRLYYNLTSIHDVIGVAPFGARLMEYFDTFVGADSGIESKYTKRQHRPAGSVFMRFLEAGYVLLSATWHFLGLDRGIRQFERKVDVFASETRVDTLTTRTLSNLYDDMHGFLDIRFDHWTYPALADAATMMGSGALKSLLDRWLPEKTSEADYGAMLKGMEGLVSSQSVIALWSLCTQIRREEALRELFTTGSPAEILGALTNHEADLVYARFRREFEEYLHNWGCRCSGELMLTRENFQENPGALISILVNAIERSASAPMELQQRASEECRQVTEKVLEELAGVRLHPLVPGVTRATIIKRLLKWTRRAIAYRERARLKQALLYARLRQILLAQGDRLQEQGILTGREDIFWLTYHEIDAIVGREPLPGDVVRRVARRRAENELYSAITPPSHFYLAEGEQLPIDDISPAGNDGAIVSVESLKGISVCAGIVTGPARVLNDVMESGRLRAGDILVTRQTDPGWGPVFCIIDGLLIERGGLLSHGAILAREFGLPAIVGLEDATRLIPEGATVTVNADDGVAQILG